MFEVSLEERSFSLKYLYLNSVFSLCLRVCGILCAEGEVWICKPTGMNQGKGIYLVKTPAEVEKLRESKGANHIIQRYVYIVLLYIDT